MEYLTWLQKQACLKTLDNRIIELYKLEYDIQNTKALSEWAKHFRQMYCDDSKIDLYRKGEGLSRKDFLTNRKFPDIQKKPGPSTRAGDFAEILISDFLEYMEGYWVPRTRYNKKPNKDMSTPGTDVVAIKKLDLTNCNPNDELLLFEVKASFNSEYKKSGISRLQDAINDSDKDVIRKAITLAAMKERFIDQNDITKVESIERFQNPLDNPYKEKYGAAALLSEQYFHLDEIARTDSSTHSLKNKLRLLVIRAKDFKMLSTLIYQRAADEA